MSLIGSPQVRLEVYLAPGSARGSQIIVLGAGTVKPDAVHVAYASLFEYQIGVSIGRVEVADPMVVAPRVVVPVGIQLIRQTRIGGNLLLRRRIWICNGPDLIIGTRCRIYIDLLPSTRPIAIDVEVERGVDSANDIVQS